MRRARLWAGLAVFASACSGLAEREVLPPEGQLLLGVATDAWLPRGPNEPREDVEALPLFERLRIELFAPGETAPCRDCVRDFGLDSRTASEGRATVGFVPRAGLAGYRARVRLYHSGPSESYAEPRVRSTIEAVIALPAVASEGIVTVHVVLRTDDVGRPRGTLDEPVAAEQGPPPRGLAGAWNAELRRSCPEPAGEDEACVPGGAFWMGDPSFSVPYERLVAVSPFYLDVREATVADVRRSGVARAGGTADPRSYRPGDPTSSAFYCTWTATPGEHEELPINCISRAAAREHCEALGRRLPSEAEMELVAGARRDATFPWGEKAPECGDAVYGRTYDTSMPREYRACLDAGAGIRPGVAKAGSGALDRVRMPDGHEILDLAANLSEWSLDEYTSIGESCLDESPVVDPVCATKSAAAPGRSLIRGDSWQQLGGGGLRAAVRSSIDALADPEVGFRCARDAR